MQHFINRFSEITDNTVTLKGWVANMRTSKTNLFIVFRDGTGYCQLVINDEEVGEETFENAKKLTQESSIEVTGTLVKDERQMGGYEVQVKDLKIIHISEEYPISNKEHGVRFLSDNRHLWLRSRRQWAIMRVRNQIIMSIHEFFQNENFVQMDSPIFTANAAEGTTTLFETDYFGEPAYLAQTGQLYGEAMAMAQGRIYTFGPTFRAEKSDTPRHLAEFWMIEPEVAFNTNEDNMDLIENFIRFVINRVIAKCSTELEVLERDLTKLESVNQIFPRVLYEDAVKILRGEHEVDGKNAIRIQEEDLTSAKENLETKLQEIKERESAIKGGLKKGEKKFNETKILELRKEVAELEEKLRNIPKWIESAKNFQSGEDFGNSDETVLTRVFEAPVMVYNWPTAIKAFYMKEVEGDPDHVKGVDLLAPDGYGEIIGGSERETDIAVLIKKIQDHGLPMEPFEWYLDLRRFGSVPHSGFGLGLERVVRWVCGITHLRETVPFPRRYGQLKP